MTSHPFRRLFAARLHHIAGAPLTLALLALAGCEAEQKIECISWDSALGACLSREDALTEMKLDETCADTHHSVDSDATYEDGQCCYKVTISDECCYGNGCPIEGRPLIVGGVSLLAPVSRGNPAWSAPLATGGAELTDRERAEVAEMWLTAARQEHASIASFGRFALALLAFGAPPELITATHTAALDEIRHARAAFALASRYAKEPLGPGAFPMPKELPMPADLTDLVASLVEEGCVGETIAALFAVEQRLVATDHEVCTALDAVCAEEAKHAELAWAALRWAIDRGGERVLVAAQAAFERTAHRLQHAAPDAPFADTRPEVVASHGRLSQTVFNQVAKRALKEVILPAVKALATSAPSTREPLAASAA